jgi:hypothetical protein
VLDDLCNGGVPVVPVPVVKNAVAPHHEIVGVAVRESRGDGHLVRAPSAGAVAVGEVRLAQRGERAVLRGIIHTDAELAASPVQIQGARLEHRLPIRRVEVGKGNEVIEQTVEIPVVAHQAIHRGNGLGLGFKRFVFGNECSDLFFGVAGKDLAYPAQAELLDGCAGLFCQPLPVRTERGKDGRPLVGGQAGPSRTEKGRNHLGLQLAEGLRPRRVHPLFQGQWLPGLHLRQGERGKFGAGSREVLAGKGREVFL